MPIQDNDEPLVDLAGFDFVLESMYFKLGFSETPKMLLRKGAANRLADAQKKLDGFKFKVWDGYRPHSAQQGLYERVYEDMKREHPKWNHDLWTVEVLKYVAPWDDPGVVPPHCTGGTVDLTLVGPDGKELAMGTAFDHFGPESAPYYFERISPDETIAQNRKMLREALFVQDFVVNDNEWWHFEYGTPNWAVANNKPYACYGEVVRQNLGGN